MRRFLFTSLLLTMACLSKAQVWESLDYRTVSGLFYLNGTTYISFAGPTGQPGTFATIDENGNRFEVKLPDSLYPGRPVFFDDQNGILVTAFRESASDKRAYKTDDGGKSWELYQPVYNFEGFISETLEVVDGQTVMGRSRSRVFISEDRGLTWNLRESNSALYNNISNIESFGPDLIFTASELNGIYKSTNLGKSWQLIFDIPVFSFHMLSSERGYAIEFIGSGIVNEIVLHYTVDGWNTYSTSTIPLSEYVWLYMFVITQKEELGFIMNEEFYLVKDFHLPNPEPVLYQKLNSGINPVGMYRFGSTYFLHTHRHVIRLNEDRDALPYDPDNIEVITSIEEDEQATLLYPNPAERIVQVTDSRYDQFELISTTGSVLLKASIVEGEIDLKTQATGVYIIRLSDSKALSTPRSVRIRLN